MKTKNKTEIKLITDNGSAMEMTIPEGTLIDDLISQLFSFSPKYRWNDRNNKNNNKELESLENGSIVIVDSSYGVVPAYVSKYPNKTLLQDISSNSDEGMQNDEGDVFTVSRWKHLNQD